MNSEKKENVRNKISRKKTHQQMKLLYRKKAENF
jgi:hypothetical protein